MRLWYNTLVGSAAFASWAMAAHLSLIAVGQMTYSEPIGPLCREATDYTANCTIVMGRDDIQLSQLAHQLNESAWRLWLDNPTVPVIWPLSIDTQVRVTRKKPEPVDW
jgi:hypothetical protein